MTPTLEQIAPALRNLHSWLATPNICGIFAAPKRIGGRDTDTPSIQFLVARKLPASDLEEGDRPLPAALEIHVQAEDGSVRTVSVPTDVVEVGRIRFATTVTTTTLNKKVRPTCGGLEIAVKADGGSSHGTLGANLVWAGKYRMITCNHVIADNDPKRVGKKVYQPDTNASSFTTVTGYVPRQSSSSQDPNPYWNTYDFAWCDTDPSVGDSTVWNLGIVRGYRAPKLGERIQWIGQVTGEVQTANLTNLGGVFAIPDDTKKGYKFYYNSVIQVSAGTATEGDSGAAFCGTIDMYVVGLLSFVDGKGNAYGTPIPV